ncbi:MAG: Uncharacterised protein [Alphaproteobacteria bacterium]|nr:MAG: Uncharacterised protein [Alphaproteobacteria bacterium]
MGFQKLFFTALHAGDGWAWSLVILTIAIVIWVTWVTLWLKDLNNVRLEWRATQQSLIDVKNQLTELRQRKP